MNEEKREEKPEWWEEKPYKISGFKKYEDDEYDFPLILSTHRAKVIKECVGVVESEYSHGSIIREDMERITDQFRALSKTEEENV